MNTVSETKLFVGRLPADARIEEVEDVFGAFGKIIKLGHRSTYDKAPYLNNCRSETWLCLR